MHVAMEIRCRKDFRAAVNGEQLAHTVDDGTNDLVNLSTGGSLGASEPSERREGIELRRLEGAACDDGGRSSKSSPPEGPGQTAIKKNTGQRDENLREAGEERVTNLLNMVMELKSEKGIG